MIKPFGWLIDFRQNDTWCLMFSFVNKLLLETSFNLSRRKNELSPDWKYVISLPSDWWSDDLINTFLRMKNFKGPKMTCYLESNLVSSFSLEFESKYRLTSFSVKNLINDRNFQRDKISNRISKSQRIRFLFKEKSEERRAFLYQN